MPDNAPATIVVVDDKEGTRYTLARLLRKAGYVVREAATGEEALRLAADKPDLIVLDIKLPDINGLEVCRRVKADPATGSVLVLHLSATFADSDSRSLGLEGGADGYLTYPVEPRELLASVEALLRLRRADRLAQERGELLRVTLASIGDAVIATDPAGRVTFLNPVAEALTGWAAADAAGRPLNEVFRIVNEQTRQPVGSPAERALREGTVVGLANHSVLIARDGSERPIDDSAAPIRDGDGRVVGAVMVFRDVTERRQVERTLKESQERLRLMVESVTDYAIITLDTRGVVSSWNAGAERVFGYAEAEIVGRGFDVLFTPEDRAAGAPAQEQATAARDGRAADERWHLRQDGSRFFASGTLTPVRAGDGPLLGFTKVTRDITERKRAEEALKDADRRKDEFLAMLAHELRNPLAPISNALHLVRLHGADPQQALEMIERQVEHMVRLVDDLLDVSRITRGKIELRRERVDLAAVAVRAVEGSRPLIDARRHRLEMRLPDGPLPVDGDPMRLAQVVWNLLNNAAKYTPEGGRIALTVEAAGGEAVVRVRDTGMGIPADMLARVFDLFTQVDRTLDRAEGGLGIGLTLVRRLTEMHGGTVAAHSAGPGQGSEFVVRLPLAAGAPAEAPVAGAPAVPPGPAPRGRRILLVDDNRDSADSLAMLLQLLGHDVRTAYDGRQALVVAGAYQPDLVLLDIGLPGLNGYEVAAQLRAMFGTGRMVLVALTGYGSQEDRRQTREAGFDDHLVKPVDLDALRELLASLGPVSERAGGA
jgi:PAS domain S-box-containing protein